MVGVKGTAAPNTLTTLASKVNSMGLKGIIVWYASVRGGFDYDRSWDSSLNGVSQQKAIISAMKSFGGNLIGVDATHSSTRIPFRPSRKPAVEPATPHPDSEFEIIRFPGGRRPQGSRPNFPRFPGRRPNRGRRPIYFAAQKDSADIDDEEDSVIFQRLYSEKSFLEVERDQIKQEKEEVNEDVIVASQ